MNKKSFLCVFLSFCAISISAQNILEITDVSQPNDVFSSENDKACVVIKCNHSIPLTFDSSMDKSATPWTTDIEGSDSCYYIAFPTGSDYRGRVLSIMSPGYKTVKIPLELQPKQLLTFMAIDPNSQVDAGCYRGHRNKGMEELRNLNYQEARVQFAVARECSDVDTLENNRNLEIVDSLMFYRQKADALFNLQNYKEALYCYAAMLKLNPYDTYARDQSLLSIENSEKECATNFERAEYYYKEKEFDKATEYYNKVVEKGCTQMTEATKRLNFITAYRRRKANHSNVFTYEYTLDMPIGFQYGRYNMHKAGGFIALSLSPKIFKAMRKDCGLYDFPEVSIKFGWTFKIANPVWAFIGPGFNMKMWTGDYYSVDDNGQWVPKNSGGTVDEARLKDTAERGFPFQKDENGSKIFDANSRLDPSQANLDNDKLTEDHSHFGFAIPVTAGVTVKYSYFAFRLAYEYRFSIEKRLEKFFGPHRITIGVGVAF